MLFEMGKLSSGVKSSSELIYTGPCFYFGITIVNGGVAVTATLYDELSATGTEVDNYKTTTTNQTEGTIHSQPVVCRKGIYLAIDGGTAIVYYKPLPQQGV